MKDFLLAMLLGVVITLGFNLLPNPTTHASTPTPAPAGQPASAGDGYY